MSFHGEKENNTIHFLLLWMSCSVNQRWPFITFNSDMAQKGVTAHKMKSRQETTSLGQIATVTAKPTISDKHLYTLTREVLTFRRVTWDPPGQGLLYGGRHKLVPHHTNFCKFLQLCGTLSSLAKDVSLSKLAILLILRRSFQWCRWIFPNWSRSI